MEPSLVDFEDLIKKAIERDVRERFLYFLANHQLLEFGRTRAMTLDEKAMVLSCFDKFAAEAHFLDLGVARIEDLRTRLASLAQAKHKGRDRESVANACFDALACIAALEARLSRSIDRSEVPRLQWRSQMRAPANDEG